MSRGLGQTQRAILRIGFFKRAVSGQNDVIVSARDILVTHYGFTPIRPIKSAWRNALVFRKADIGLRRYNSVSVTVCHSFNGLIRRGLAERVKLGYGIKLTREGVKLAKTIC